MLVYLNRNLKLALEGIYQNKFRALLTALGIIFGVFAVVAMLAIGNGAKKSILDQLKIIGTNNIVVKAIAPSDSDDDKNSNEKEKKSYSPGLTAKDAETIARLIPDIEELSVETHTNANILFGKNLISSKCYGVNNDFFNINNLHLQSGSFFMPHQENSGANVCILGSNAASRLFLGKDPIGKYVKSNNVIFKVIGVLKNRRISKENLSKLNVNNYSNNIFTPLNTYKLRINNKIRIGKEDISDNSNNSKSSNYHQLDKLVVKLSDAKGMDSSAELINRILTRKHNDQKDFEIEVPELLIKQQQNTQETLNLVLAIIAGISLLVGGIGIMNIMLASVLERIKEIGLRRSIGATKKDIIYQFLLESIAISLSGGIIGVILGVIGSKAIAYYADISTVISIFSILISFLISVSIGIVFGILPAQRAAKLDPITALRTD